MRTEDIKAITEEYNTHIDNFNAINEWFKGMMEELNKAIEQ